MIYEKIIKAKFISRPNRFIAIVDIDGQEEKVHVKNTGRCKELLIPGATVILEDCSHIKTRKTRYSLIAVWKNDLLINMDSQVPNTVVYQGLQDNKIDALKNLSLIKREVTYKNSRFDIYFEDGDKKGFIEVKGVTLENRGRCKFPDAPTTRGTKHVYEMIDAVKNGYLGYIFFLIQMEKTHTFSLNWDTDPDFSKSIIDAKNNGVNILVYDSIVTENNIVLGSKINIDLLNK